MFTSQDAYWMEQALLVAKRADEAGEVPVGAVLVKENQLIAQSHNQPINDHDPSAHAEIRCIRAAAQQLKNYRLCDTILYVTLEPCLMCAGAMVHARIARLVYGAPDPRAGAIVSRVQALNYPFLNHKVEHAGGLLDKQCGEILSDFFRKRRPPLVSSS